jgi:hypothetical protein
MDAPLRLVIFDRTDTRPLRSWIGARLAPGPRTDGTSGVSPGLSPVWRLGTLLHRLTGAADATLAASSWAEALAWAAAISEEKRRPIGSLQVWGHGGWGFMRLGATQLDEAALRPAHPLAAPLDSLREHLAGPEALVWFRCCSTFGALAGRRFAARAASRLGCRVAGHTFIIGAFQSGTHVLRPGEHATWDEGEGVQRDAAGKAVEARWSGPSEPGTVSCLALDLPAEIGA